MSTRSLSQQSWATVYVEWQKDEFQLQHTIVSLNFSVKTRVDAISPSAVYTQTVDLSVVSTFVHK